MQHESEDIVCLQNCDNSAGNSGEVFICDDVLESETTPDKQALVISDEEDIEDESANEKKLHRLKPGSLNQKELCKELNSLLLNAMFYVMSSHKIMETESARLARKRSRAEKQTGAAQQMKQDKNDLQCSSNPSVTSDANLLCVDHTSPPKIAKDCETEVSLNTNIASGCAEGNLETDGISDQSKERCEESTINNLDVLPRSSQDSNTVHDKKTNDSQWNQISQPSCIGCNNSDNSEDQVIKEIKEDKSIIELCSNVDPVKPKLHTKSWKGPVGQPKLLTGAEMKPFQIEGFLWLKRLYLGGINGILADEMGLGKTIQCVALICDLIASGSVGPYLICSPLSTVPHWVQSFARFAPKVPILTYLGEQSERSRLRSLMYKKQTCGKKSIYPVVMTSYEIIMKDVRFLGLASFALMILDEGHRIKNANCKLLEALTKYRIRHRFLLTGTPLQNNVRELFTLLKFIIPELFSHIPSLENYLNDKFLRAADDSELLIREEEQKETISILHQILTPFMLRRLKVDVDLMIPPKQEIIIYTDLTACQKGLYKMLLEKFRNMSSQDTYTDAAKMCCPDRLRPRPATLTMGDKQAGVAATVGSVTRSKKILKMDNMNGSCSSLLTSDEDHYSDKLMSQKGKESASNEDIGQIRVCDKRREGLRQNLKQPDAICSRNPVEQGDHNETTKNKDKEMENYLLNNSHWSSSEVTGCPDNCVNTNDDSVRRRLRSGRSSLHQLSTSTDHDQSMKRRRCGVSPKLLDRNENPICSSASKEDGSAENSNVSCSFSAGSLSLEGFAFDRTSRSSFESGRGTLEPAEDRLEDVDMVSESWDNFHSIRGESDDEEMEFTKCQLHNSLSLLRQCCSHPYIIERPVRNNEIVLDDRLITSSGKMIILDRLLAQLKKDGHKVLIFCQLLDMLDFLEDYCEMRDYSYSRLDGKMSLEDRSSEISKFSSDDGVFLFLLSTRAGGYGLTLTKADTVIIYESDLNPQCDIQAQDRCHRIGQERPVKVYRLLASNTVDQMIFERAVAKKKLEQLIIHRGKFKTGMARYRALGREELEAMLKEEELRSLQAASSNGSLEISDEELHRLLDRSDLYEKWQDARRNQHDALNAAKYEHGSCTSKDIFDDIRKCTESLVSTTNVTESQEVIHLENSESLDVELIDVVSSAKVIGSQEIIDLENSESSDVELIEMISSDVEIIED